MAPSSHLPTNNTLLCSQTVCVVTMAYFGPKRSPHSTCLFQRYKNAPVYVCVCVCLCYMWMPELVFSLDFRRWLQHLWFSLGGGGRKGVWGGVVIARHSIVAGQPTLAVVVPQ